MLLFNTLYIIIICYINISFQQLLCPVVIVTHNLSHNAQKHTVHNNTPLLHHHHHHHFYYYFIIYYFFTINHHHYYYNYNHHQQAASREKQPTSIKRTSNTDLPVGGDHAYNREPTKTRTERTLYT